MLRMDWTMKWFVDGGKWWVKVHKLLIYSLFFCLVWRLVLNDCTNCELCVFSYNLNEEIFRWACDKELKLCHNLSKIMWKVFFDSLSKLNKILLDLENRNFHVTQFTNDPKVSFNYTRSQLTVIAWQDQVYLVTEIKYFLLIFLWFDDEIVKIRILCEFLKFCLQIKKKLFSIKKLNHNRILRK